MIFESLLKENIQNYFAQDYGDRIKFSNDFHQEYSAWPEIVGVIKTTAGMPINLAGVKAVNQPILLQFQVKTTIKEEFLIYLQNFVFEYNGATEKLDNLDVSFSFNTPSSTDTIDIHDGISYLNYGFTGNCIYSDSLFSGSIKLKMNNQEIPNILAWQFNTITVAEPIATIKDYLQPSSPVAANSALSINVSLDLAEATHRTLLEEALNSGTHLIHKIEVKLESLITQFDAYIQNMTIIGQIGQFCTLQIVFARCDNGTK